jgi:hypothetical protein
LSVVHMDEGNHPVRDVAIWNFRQVKGKASQAKT